MNNNNEVFLTPVDVEEIFKIAVPTQAVWRSTNRHNIPYVKIGGLVRYPKNEFIEWIRDMNRKEKC